METNQRSNVHLTYTEICLIKLLDRAIPEGWSSAMIANEMNVSQSTLKNHLHRLNTKFGTNSRGEMHYIVRSRYNHLMKEEI